MKPTKAFHFLGTLVATVTLTAPVMADSFTSTAATTAWSAGRWNNTTDATPYTAAYTANNNVQFNNTAGYSFAGMGGTINVGNVTLANNVVVRFTAAANTFATGGNVRTLNIGTGAILDFAGQSFSTGAGAGYIKSGAGILSLAGNTYPGGFTLNAGTVILRGVNAMGAGGALTINGGTITATANRDLTGKYPTGITVGGDFTFGSATTGVPNGDAVVTANLTFTDLVGLGAASRTITLGGNGNYALNGTISGSAGTGLTVVAASGATGSLLLGGTNTFTGPLVVSSGSVSIPAINDNSSVGPLGNSATSVQLGSTGNTGILNFTGTTSSGNKPFTLATGGTGAFGSSTLGANITVAGAIDGGGNLSKVGPGMVTLAGTNTYGGTTTVSAGTLLFNQKNSFYNNTPASWNLANLTIASGAILGLSVGGSGEFAISDVDTLRTVSNGTNGFLAGSSIGIDTTNGGSLTYSSVVGDTNGGATSMGLAKIGANNMTLPVANTFTGPMTCAGGMVIMANDNALGAGSVNFTGGGLMSDGVTPRTISLPTTIFTAATLGDTTNTGVLTFTNVNYNGGGRIITTPSNVFFNGTSTNGYVGQKHGLGTLTLQGTHTWNGTGSLTHVRNGTYVIDGTLNNADGIRVACDQPSGAAVTTITAGNTANIAVNTANIRIGYTGGDVNASNTMNINGSLLMAAGNAQGGAVRFGLDNTKGTLNLNTGGLIQLKTIFADTGSGYSIFNWNGGTLKVLDDTVAATFINGNTTPTDNSIKEVNIQAGGARVDTNGFNVTGTKSLSHDAALGATPDGGFTKLGTGMLTLTAANTYTGPTMVSAGTLSLSAASLANSAAVTVDTGAVLNLTHASTDVVGSLTLGGVAKVPGTYHAGNSGGFITGTGSIQVLGPGYSGWASTNSVTGTKTDDDDQDGLTNMMEYALGLNPHASSQPVGSLSGGTVSFTKGSEAVTNGDVTFIIQESDDLGFADPWADVVTHTPPNASPTISYALSAGTRKFTRLKVQVGP